MIFFIRLKPLFVAALPLLAATARMQQTAISDRTVINFNSGWLFSAKEISNGEAVELNEKPFKRVVLPHTVSLVPHRSIDTLCFAGISWYRKHFAVPVKFRGKRITIEFQGVAKAAEVFINGEKVGGHKGAYTPFTCDLTGKLFFEKDNVLAVRVDSRQRKDIPPEGKDVDFLIGGGIVRDVRLIITNPVYVDWVYARRDTACSASVAVTARIVNSTPAKRSGVVIFAVADTAHAIAAQASQPFSLDPVTAGEFHAAIGPFDSIRLWHPDHPYLYTVRTQVRDSTACLDDHTVRFGLRSIAFGKTDGVFSVNGRPLKLRGLNRHETFPFVGRAAANRLQAREADIIKFDFGCNIVRTSHYPQDPEFLDRCDEIGLLVLEEMAGWNFVRDQKEWQAVAIDNLEEMIMRDRNHPSIISFGVRINQSADFAEFYAQTNRIARKLDPTRPTHGVRVLGRGYKAGFLEDVWAQNFVVPAGKPPFLPWITTECVGHNLPVRSWDDGEQLLRQMLAHAAAHDSIAANQYISGGLGWCAFDYHSPYIYAQESVCYHGVADMFRIPKHAAYFYRSQADPALYGPMVYIAHHWDKALVPNDVWVAGNCDSVELFVNDSSLGKQAGSEYRSLPHPLFVWRDVPFSAGEIRAIGYIGGRVAATFARTTPRPAVRLLVLPDDTVLYAGGDMTRVVVRAVDASGQTALRDSSLVRLSVRGAAAFLGENPVTLENGATAFFVQTNEKTGRVVCHAKSAKIAAAKAIIRVQALPHDWL